MIQSINPFLLAAFSIASAFVGSFHPKIVSVVTSMTVQTANIGFQHFAWTLAGLAGLVSFVNGITKFIDWYELRRNNKLRKKLNQQLK